MKEVKRIKGETKFGTYVVSVFVTDGRIERIDTSGIPNRMVSEMCAWISKTKTKLVQESVKAVKLSMCRCNEYRGELCTKNGPISM